MNFHFYRIEFETCAFIRSLGEKSPANIHLQR